MTVFENVMVSSVYGRKHIDEGDRNRALEALELVELTGKRDILTVRTSLSWIDAC